MKKIKLALLTATTALAACTVGPDYEAPKQTLAVSFAEGEAVLAAFRPRDCAALRGA